MAVVRNEPDRNGFNRNLPLPFNLRLQDFELAMQDVYFNGHPDLLLQGHYPNDKARAGDQGVEIKTTRKPGGAVDTRGARSQWMCVFVFSVDEARAPPPCMPRGLPNCAPVGFTF